MPFTSWNDISALSIQVYDLPSGADTATLADTTTIYANNNHQAIVVISFIPLDAGNVPIMNKSTNMPTASAVRNAIELLNYDTGSLISTATDGHWLVTTNPSAFARPLNMDANAKFSLPLCTLSNNLYTLVYYVQVSSTTSTMNVGMKLDLSKLSGSMGTKIITSSKAGDYKETCSIATINQSEIPFELLCYDFVYNSDDDDVPDSGEVKDDIATYSRAVHLAYYLNWEEASGDFSYNNAIFNIGIDMTNKVYDGINSEPTSAQQDPKNSTTKIVESCCFLDQRDGFYAYKGYLWPKCLAEKKNLYIPDITAQYQNIQKFSLYQNAMPPQHIDLSDIYAGNSSFDFSVDKCIYMTIYLTFGYEIQYYKRQLFYAIYIIDQYGNKLNVYVNPSNCPNLFSLADAPNSGINAFANADNEWLSHLVDAQAPKNDVVGSFKNVFGFLIPHPAIIVDPQVLNFNYNDGGDGSDIAFQSIDAYDTFHAAKNTGYAIRTIRTENQSDNAFTYEKRTYKLGMFPSLNKDINTVIGIQPDNDQFEFQVMNIRDNEPPKNMTYNWKFYPVWDNGGFIMYGLDAHKTIDNATLMVVDSSTDSRLYQIGHSSDFSDAIFTTIPAFNFDPDSYEQKKDSPTQGPLDIGSGLIGNPYKYNPSNPARGDWADIMNVQLSWAGNPEQVGMTIYPNGLHQAQLVLKFDALQLIPGTPTSISNYCHECPSLDYVNKALSIIDYDTGNLLSVGAEDWEFSTTASAFTTVDPRASWGNNSNLPSNTNAGQPYNYIVNIYISNNSSKPLSPRKLGIRFTLKDPNWSAPLILNMYAGVTGSPPSPVLIKTFELPTIDVNSINLQTQYTYYGMNDNSAQGSQGTPCSLYNYNRYWDLLFTPALSSTAGRIAGWRRVGVDSTAAGYSTTAMMVGSQSAGLYHNEFWLSPTNSFTTSDLSTTWQVPSNTYSVTPIAGGSKTINSPRGAPTTVQIGVYASFSGKCNIGYNFPPLNIEWVDIYGNIYPFSIALSSLPMLFTDSDSKPLPGQVLNYVHSGYENQTFSETDTNQIHFAFSTTADDHSLVAGTFDSGKGTYSLIYGSPGSEDAIQLYVWDGKSTGRMDTIDSATVSSNAYKFLLNFSKKTKDRNDNDLWGVGSSYDTSTIGNTYYGYGTFIGAILSTRFNFSIQPIWTNGHIAFLNLDYTQWLNIIDDGKNEVVFFTTYNTINSNFTIAATRD